jgi:hypothetical protein
MKDEEQKAKEKVIQLGISKGLAIFTRGEEIVSKDGEGHENIISTSDDKSTRWQDALKVLLEDNSVTKTTEKQRSLKVYTDGGSRGNPGPSASGYVIMNEENEIIEEGGELKGIYKIKNRDLWPIHSDIKDIAENFDKVTYTHVRREHNKLADAKVNEVLDSHTS